MASRPLADLFAEMAESVRRRKDSQKHNKDVLRAGIKALSSATADSENTQNDELILACAPKAFHLAYPRSTPWSGDDLKDLLKKMTAILELTSQGKPVHVYELDEALEFCKSMRELLANKANGNR